MCRYCNGRVNPQSKRHNYRQSKKMAVNSAVMDGKSLLYAKAVTKQMESDRFGRKHVKRTNMLSFEVIDDVTAPCGKPKNENEKPSDDRKCRQKTIFIGSAVTSVNTVSGTKSNFLTPRPSHMQTKKNGSENGVWKRTRGLFSSEREEISNSKKLHHQTQTS